MGGFGINQPRDRRGCSRKQIFCLSLPVREANISKNISRQIYYFLRLRVGRAKSALLFFLQHTDHPSDYHTRQNMAGKKLIYAIRIDVGASAKSLRAERESNRLMPMSNWAANEVISVDMVGEGEIYNFMCNLTGGGSSQPALRTFMESPVWPVATLLYLWHPYQPTQPKTISQPTWFYWFPCH